MNLSEMPVSFEALVCAIRENIDTDKLGGCSAEIAAIEAAKALSIAAGGGHLYIPKIDSVERNNRNKQILSEFHKGTGCRQIAKKYNLSESHVRSIINELRTPQATIEDFLGED